MTNGLQGDSSNGARRVRIAGTGRSVPERVLTNADLERIVDTSNDWIIARTGIEERRVASDEEYTSVFAVDAARKAIEMAGVEASDVDLVLISTVTPDMPFPATACLVQEELGAKDATAFDLNAGCTGFVYGLSVAHQYVSSGAASTALVIGAESLTKYTDYEDRSTCVLFGDGAGAVVLRGEDPPGPSSANGLPGILSVAIHSDGSLAHLLEMPGGGSRNPPNRPETLEARLPFIRMLGNETFKVAVRTLAEVSGEVLEGAGQRPEDVRWLIPHQANRRIIDAVGRRIDVPADRVYVNVERYGNTSAASIPIALDELNRDGRIEPGDLVLMAAFGAGLTWGAAAVRF